MTAMDGHDEVVEFLLEKGAKVENVNVPLMGAAPASPFTAISCHHLNMGANLGWCPNFMAFLQAISLLLTWPAS